jgi:hypothetical protein
MEGVGAFYSFLLVRWRSISAAIAGRGARRRAGALARVDGGQAEDEDCVSSLIPTKGYMGWVGLRLLDRLAGRCWTAWWAASLGFGGQVSPGKFFPSFPFLFDFLFCFVLFEFRFEFIV